MNWSDDYVLEEREWGSPWRPIETDDDMEYLIRVGQEMREKAVSIEYRVCRIARPDGALEDPQLVVWRCI